MELVISDVVTSRNELTYSDEALKVTVAAMSIFSQGSWLCLRLR